MVKISKVRADTSWAWRNSSGTWMVAASAVSLTSEIKLLPKGGNAVRIAWGRMALRKGEPELLDEVNKALDKMRADGTLKTLSEKYFNADVTQ